MITRRRAWGCFLALSLAANVAGIAAIAVLTFGPWSVTVAPTTELGERHVHGTATARDKVAVVRISGAILESNNAFAIDQIKVAAKDPAVKAVVLRIDSPGGTISASEDLYRAIVELRDATGKRFPGSGPKPVVASMGALAASGGYYVAMPAKPVFAEPTTITGSIGVFAALPNVHGLIERNGVKVELIKAGAIKAGGAMFQPLSPDERQPWQDMVDNAYDRFLGVVAAGRPPLTKEQLANEKTERRVPKYDDKGNPVKNPDGSPVLVNVVRVRADGGTYTPEQAQSLGLIDAIGELSDATQAAATAAGLSSWRAVDYVKPKTWSESLIGIRAAPSPTGDALAPRLWYLAPGYELAGILP